MKARWIAICVLSACGLCALPASATLNTFQGGDPGAQPGDPRPNSSTAAAAFYAAAGSLGAQESITFESLALGNFTSLAIAPGVVASQVNNDAGIGGIVQLGYATPIGAATGYNTTPNGSKFLAFVPQFDVGTARLDFTFASPIQAFGCYLIGLETGISGSVYALFDDGTSRDIPIADLSTAGAQFWGFTSPGASILAVSFEERGIFGSRDIYGIDDITFVQTPEPATLSLLALGGLLIARRRRA